MEHNQAINQASYLHKKFASQKRKRDTNSKLEQQQKYITQETTNCKRRQLKGFFRPWLDNQQSTENGHKTMASPIPAASTYHANMVRQFQSKKQRSPKEQQRRDRNTLACLLNRRAKQAEDAHLAQQYEQYLAQQAAILEQQVRFSFYYRQLLQQAVFQQAVPVPGVELPPQQQEFLQQMSLSQQLLIFGSHK